MDPSLSAFVCVELGTTKENQAPVSSPFVGCLRNVKLNGSPVAFEAESRVGHVISGCPAD